MLPPITITITITITVTGSIWPDYYYYYYSGILRSLLLLLLLLLHKSVITITITISNSLTTLLKIYWRERSRVFDVCVTEIGSDNRLRYTALPGMNESCQTLKYGPPSLIRVALVTQQASVLWYEIQAYWCPSTVSLVWGNFGAFSAAYITLFIPPGTITAG